LLLPVVPGLDREVRLALVHVRNVSTPLVIRVMAVQAGTTGSKNYGTFTLAADGHWEATARQHADGDPAAGRPANRSPTASPAVSSDGTASQLITVTINGTNDVPVLGGVHLARSAKDNGAAGVAAITLMTSAC